MPLEVETPLDSSPINQFFFFFPIDPLPLSRLKLLAYEPSLGSGRSDAPCFDLFLRFLGFPLSFGKRPQK